MKIRIVKATLLNKIRHFFVYPFLENGFLLGGIVLLRKTFNTLYNILFLSRKHIKADYSSDIKGTRFMSIGSVVIGKYCRIEMISFYGGKRLNPKLKIGNRVSINDMVHIGCANYVEIGDDCVFASKIYISDHNHGIYKGSNQSQAAERVVKRELDIDKSVIIGKNVWLGEGVSVLPGSSIGDNCIIGANAVVCGTIQPNTIAVGIPAKEIKKFDSNTGTWLKCCL